VRGLLQTDGLDQRKMQARTCAALLICMDTQTPAGPCFGPIKHVQMEFALYVIPAVCYEVILRAWAGASTATSMQDVLIYRGLHL
jgi:hypothetical protein